MIVSPKKENTKLSIYMIAVLVFLSHGFANTLLTSPINPLRCTFWKAQKCTPDQDEQLNWLALGYLQVYILLACLASKAIGNSVLEQKLASLSATMMLNYISTGIFTLHSINRPMAILQCIIYWPLLFVIGWQISADSNNPPPVDVQGASFDRRARLHTHTAAVGFHFLLETLKLYGTVFQRNTDHASFENVISLSVTNQSLWATIIIGWSLLQGTKEQHCRILVGQVIVLFLNIVILSGMQSEKLDDANLRARGINCFFGILIAVVGSK